MYSVICSLFIIMEPKEFLILRTKTNPAVVSALKETIYKKIVYVCNLSTI